MNIGFIYIQAMLFQGLPYITQLLGSCNSDDVPKALVDKINKIM